MYLTNTDFDLGIVITKKGVPSCETEILNVPEGTHDPHFHSTCTKALEKYLVSAFMFLSLSFFFIPLIQS